MIEVTFKFEDMSVSIKQVVFGFKKSVLYTAHLHEFVTMTNSEKLESW